MESIATPQEDSRAFRAWVLFELSRRGLSYAEIGRRQRPPVTRQAVRRAFIQNYPRMERAIADAIGRKQEELWPERCAKRAGAR